MNDYLIRNIRIADGSCGVSPFPFTEKHNDELKAYCAQISVDAPEDHWKKWSSYKGYRQDAAAQDPLINDLHLVGHGSLRIAVMGMENRPPTDEEMRQMKDLLREAMENGATGMSSGLIYPPGVYSGSEEITELCRVLAEYDGVYSTHMRNEGAHILEALAEAINAGLESGCKVLISHHKITGGDPELQKAAFDMMEEARSAGLRIINDQYMYNTGSTTMAALLPPYVLEDGIAAANEKLADPAYRERVRESILKDTDWQNFLHETDHDTIIVIRADSTPQ